MKALVVLVLAVAAVPTTILLVEDRPPTAEERLERAPERVTPVVEPLSPMAPLPTPGHARLAIEEQTFPPRRAEPDGAEAPAGLEASLAQMIEDLRDDDVRWNATHAAKRLGRQAREGAERRREIRAALEPHAAAADDQLRTLACSLLIEIDLLEIEDGRRTAALPALLDQASAWLASRPSLDSRFFGRLSYYRTVVFAMEHIDEIEGRLVDAVSRPRGREVFSHAFVLGATGRTRLTGLLVPLLVEHLRDNYESDDACMATEALIGLGRAALPWFEAELDSVGDSQQRHALDAIILEVTAPTRTRAQAEARERTPKLSSKYLVPARSWRFRTSYKRMDRTEGF